VLGLIFGWDGILAGVITKILKKFRISNFTLWKILECGIRKNSGHDETGPLFSLDKLDVY